METLRPLLKFPCLLGMPEFGAQRRDRQLWLHMESEEKKCTVGSCSGKQLGRYFLKK